jgi:hypothetical protein
MVAIKVLDILAIYITLTTGAIGLVATVVLKSPDRLTWAVPDQEHLSYADTAKEFREPL